MSYTLSAQSRTEKGRKTQVLRAQGQVPAIVYGSETEPTSIAIDRNTFLKVYKQAGESMIVELKIDDKNPLHVLIQDMQIDPIANDVTHIDFRSIDMKEEIETDVDLEFVGEPMAVKALGGTLVTSLDYVTVRCLPNKLIRTIKVDLTKLATFDDVIRVSDLELPEGVVVLDDLESSIAIVEAPRSEEELAALEGAVEEDVTAVEVAGKKEEGEGEATGETEAQSS